MLLILTLTKIAASSAWHLEPVLVTYTVALYLIPAEDLGGAVLVVFVLPLDPDELELLFRAHSPVLLFLASGVYVLK